MTNRWIEAAAIRSIYRSLRDRMSRWCTHLLLVSIIACVAPAQTISTAHYTVTNAATFPSLPLPAQSIVYRNGVYQNKGTTYTATGGTRLSFKPGVLVNGDTIDVVTVVPVVLPPPPPVPQTYTFGDGFNAATTGAATEVDIDTSYVVTVVEAPAAPGPCAGTATVATDGAYVYVCTADPVAPGMFAWSRAPFAPVSAWSTAGVVLTIDAANPPTGVQWTLGWDPATVATLTEMQGPALAAAGATMTCAPDPNGRATATCLAIIMQPVQGSPAATIPGGTIATVWPVLQPNAAAVGALTVSNVVATSAAGAQVNVTVVVQ